MTLPTFQRIRQPGIINAPSIAPDDIAAAVQETLDSVFPRSEDQARQAVTPRIALGVGSRGIANIDRIAKAAVDVFTTRGYDVFIVPAMGSHGGSNAEGQTATLAHYGVTEQTMGVPVKADMATVEIASRDGIPVGIAKVAWQPDTLLFPVGRVKAHTHIVDKNTQSGLRKMLLIGFGKRDYAQSYHALAGTNGLGPVIASVSEAIIATGRVLGGLAIVDGPNHRTHLVEALGANQFAAREPELLALADSLMPTFPSQLDRIGVLHLGQIGKAISGSGADPNVASVGLDGNRRVPGKGKTPIGVICASKPHPDTDGNLIGISMMDVVTQQLADARGEATWENARSAGSLAGVEVQLAKPNDQEMLDWAMQQVASDLPLVSIKDTLSLGELIVDQATADSLDGSADVEIASDPFEAEFDNGELTNFWKI